MTIVMEEDVFSSSLSSLSSNQSPSQSNYQTLVNSNNGIRDRDILNVNYMSSNTNTSTSQQLNSSSSLSNSPSSQENCPFALFLFRSNSSLELFEERRISLDKPCKIGRSVAKVRPEPNNAIFDCKVLSRNHALMWEENGKYYLQDTKSSNGTFLNGTRLGKSNEDSAPFELTSGDIIQFGVDVTENTKKVTHGCITVEVKLYHRPGYEAINKPNQQANKVDVQTQELYQLALFLQEAIMREEILHQKLNSLQGYIDQAKESSENGWLTLIDEDRLLSRIDYLEKQLLINTKNSSDENLVKKVNLIKDEKFNVENSAKLTIEKLVNEKNELSQKYDELKTLLSSRDTECNQLQKVYDESKKSLIDLAEKYQELLNQIDELQKNLNETKTKYTEKVNQSDNEKQKYDHQLAEYASSEKKLLTQIESLIAEKDFQTKRLEGVLNKLEQNKHLLQLDLNNGYKENGHPNQNEEIETEHIPVSSNSSSCSENTDTKRKSMTSMSEPILNDLSNIDETKSNSVHSSKSNEATELIQHELRTRTSEGVTNNNNNNNNNNNSDSLSCINNDEKENLIPKYNQSIDSNELINENEQSTTSLADNSNIKNEKTAANLNKTIDGLFKINDLTKLNEEISKLKNQLENEVKKNFKLREEIKQSSSNSESFDRSKSLEKQLEEKLNKINSLELDLEQKNLLINKLLNENRYISNKTIKSFDSSSSVMQPSLTNDSSELLKNMEITKRLEEKSNFLNEYFALKEEYSQIKCQIQLIDSGINMFMEKNQQTIMNEKNSNSNAQNYTYLVDSYTKLKELKETLESKESIMELNLTDAQKEADQNRLEYYELGKKFKEIKDTCEEQSKRLVEVDSLLEDITVGYDNISLRAKIVSYFSMIPLFILVIAIMIAFYPALATITATGL